MYEDMIEVFTIFLSYKGQGYGISAEHDVIYAGPSPEVVSQEHKERLEELGWSEDNDNECFYRFV